MSGAGDVDQLAQSDSVHRESPRDLTLGMTDADYTTPRNYATSARLERDRLIAEGASPGSVVLQSELRLHCPRHEGESAADYAPRLAATMRAMIRRGVAILADNLKADTAPLEFFTADGRSFDLSPQSGVTREEYLKFRHWFDQTPTTQGQQMEVPEKWRRFLRPGKSRP